MEIVIGHCHVAAKPHGRDESGRQEIGTIPALLRIMEEAGVSGAVAFAPFGPQDGVEANEWLCRELEKCPNLIGFAVIDPKQEGAADKLRLCAQMGLRGLKIHPPVMRTAIDDPASKPLYQAAEELSIPIVFHTGAHGWYLRNYMPILFDDVAQDHPGLPIIIAHVGGQTFFDQALAVMLNNKNCYAGLTMEWGPSGRFPASALRPDQVDILLDTVGPSRILYGLGYPWNCDNLAALKKDIEWILGWDIPDEDKQKILGGNLTRLVEPAQCR